MNILELEIVFHSVRGDVYLVLHETKSKSETPRVFAFCKEYILIIIILLIC